MIKSRLNNSGFTLVELMMAVAITLIGLMGLLEAINVAMLHNLKNQLRDEAVLIGEQTMSFQKVRPFDDLSSSHPAPVNSRVRGGGLQYTVRADANPSSKGAPDPASQMDKLITVTVGWNYKGAPYSHEVRSFRSR